MTGQSSKALTDPRFEQVICMVTESLRAVNSKLAYRAALTQFLTWTAINESNIVSRQTVQRYRGHLETMGNSAATVNLQLCAIRKMAHEMKLNGMISRDIAEGIEEIKGAKRAGRRSGNWLTAEQCQRLLRQPDATTRRGTRDRAILGMFLGCGLRRAELSALRMVDIQQREGRWVIADMAGKGERIRTVPIPNQVKVMVDQWREGIDCEQFPRVFLPLTKGRNAGPAGQRLSADALHTIVGDCARQAGLGAIHPHDLRRTFARLVHKARAPLDQIKETLGHSSIQTTELYLGSQQNLASAPCDLLDIWEGPRNCI